MFMMANGTFPTSRARALLCIAHDPEARPRDPAAGLLELVVVPAHRGEELLNGRR